MDDDVRARLVSLVADAALAHDDRALIRDLLHELDVLLAERAQAAPVLAAAAGVFVTQPWTPLKSVLERLGPLKTAVEDWRAARGKMGVPPGTPPVVAQAATGVAATRTCDWCATPLTPETAIYQGDVRLCAPCAAREAG